MTHLTDEELVLYYYAEGDGLPVAHGHLALCAECAKKLAALEQSLSAVSASTVPERGESYGRVVWARIESRLEERQSRPWHERLTTGLFTWPRASTPMRVPHWGPRLALVGGMAVLVVAAFVAGRNWPDSVPASPAVAPVSAAMTAEGQQRVLYGAVRDHLERSAMVLVELTNSHGNRSMDISNEQVFTEDLVASNRLYRQSAAHQGESGLVNVLEQLERVLVEIANSPSPMPAANLESLQRRIEDQGLLFKIKVLESQARQRQRDNAPAPKAASIKS